MPYALMLLLLLSWPLAANQVVRHALPETADDLRTQYPLALLRLALDHSGSDYRLEGTAAMTQSRAMALMEHNRGVDVVWTMTSREREAALRPIRIPIDKGLLGWRVLLVRGSDAGRFVAADHKTLKQMIAGQGHDWPDREILLNNRYVTRALSYDALFNMLARGHIDYVPRSVTEVQDEANIHANKGLVIEPSLMLWYPAALYYFVHPDNEHLARQIERGLEAALADGSFDQLFNQTHEPILKALAVTQRRVIMLTNPLLPEATPLQRGALWHPLPAQGTGGP
ncbi:MAG: hypothetical protein II007_04330 [Gammaproteobacteria bacterium]|nr:hypothetical protein [Gammaproteobacteria bacterium]